MHACSDLAHVGVRRVTVVIVHIGHQDVVLVVKEFYVAILFVNCCIGRYSLYTPPNCSIVFSRMAEEMSPLLEHSQQVLVGSN